MNTIVKDKMQFYGGWFLIILASFGTFYIIMPDSIEQLETIDKENIAPFVIIMLIIPLCLLFVSGYRFIERGLVVRDGSES